MNDEFTRRALIRVQLCEEDFEIGLHAATGSSSIGPTAARFIHLTIGTTAFSYVIRSNWLAGADSSCFNVTA